MIYRHKERSIVSMYSNLLGVIKIILKIDDLHVDMRTTQ